MRAVQLADAGVAPITPLARRFQTAVALRKPASAAGSDKPMTRPTSKPAPAAGAAPVGDGEWDTF